MAKGYTTCVMDDRFTATPANAEAPPDGGPEVGEDDDKKASKADGKADGNADGKRPPPKHDPHGAGDSKEQDHDESTLPSTTTSSTAGMATHQLRAESVAKGCVVIGGPEQLELRLHTGQLLSPLGECDLDAVFRNPDAKVQAASPPPHS